MWREINACLNYISFRVFITCVQNGIIDLYNAILLTSVHLFIFYIYLISGKVTFAYISFPAKNYINTNRVITSRPGK